MIIIIIIIIVIIINMTRNTGVVQKELSATMTRPPNKEM